LRVVQIIHPHEDQRRIRVNFRSIWPIFASPRLKTFVLDGVELFEMQNPFWDIHFLNLGQPRMFLSELNELKLACCLLEETMLQKMLTRRAVGKLDMNNVFVQPMDFNPECLSPFNPSLYDLVATGHGTFNPSSKRACGEFKTIYEVPY
jgi:hypothetical protein